MGVRFGDVEITAMYIGTVPILKSYTGQYETSAAIALQALTLSANTIAENATNGTVVGAVQGATSGSTVTLQDTAGSRFALSGGNIVRGATALNYEDATSHNITLRETLAGASNTPRDTVLTINVTNVLEITLAALTGTMAVTEDVAAGTLIGALGAVSSGSTLSLTDTSSNRVALSGSNVVVGSAGVPTPGSYSFTVRETNADATNSPRDTVFTLTVNSAEESETTALVARMTSAPNSTRRGHINTLIAALKSAGVWSKLDCLQVYAAHDSQASLLNWKSTSYTASNSGATFTTDRGYAGNGTSTYVQSNFVPNASPKFTATNFHMGVYSRTDASTGYFGSDDLKLVNLGASTPYWRAYFGTWETAGTVVLTGLLSVARANGTDSYLRKNGAQIDSATQGQSGLTSSATAVLANNSGGSIAAHSTAQVSAFFASEYLTTTEETAFYNAVQAYMTAVGANV